jgi:uncharacterized membrane protein YidH (DUF202 family)
VPGSPQRARDRDKERTQSLGRKLARFAPDLLRLEGMTTMDEGPSFLMVVIISIVHLAIGLGFVWLAQISRRKIDSRVWRTVASWLCYAVALIFISSAVFNTVVNILLSPFE